MNCKFCHQPCEETRADGIYLNNIHVWECVRHPYLVKQYIDVIQEDYNLNPIYLWVDTIIFVNHNKSFFRAHFYPRSFELEQIIEITDYGPIKSNTIFRLNEHPNINPENILDKIKLYLPFI